MTSTYYGIQVCLNGHIISSWMDDDNRPDAFCGICGTNTFMACPDGHLARGNARHGSMNPDEGRLPAAYCHQCGKPYAWTQEKFRAAAELIELLEADAAEKLAIRQYLETLTRDGPQQTVALIKLKAVIAKAPKAIGDGLKKVMAEVATQAAVAWMRANGLLPPS